MERVCLESLVMPRFIKDEKDVIDLEQEIRESTDDWHKRVLRVFHATTTIQVPPNQLVKSYCLSLKEHMQIAEHKELLREKVLGHIHQLEWYRVAMDDVKNSSVYYGLMEDVLAYYCTLELEVLHFKYPVRVRIARTPDVQRVIDRMYTVLTQFLGQREAHVTHALLKTKYTNRSQVGREVRKHVYDMHLFRSPTRRLSEAAYCRHYVLFLKYKELLAVETHADKDQMFRIKYGDPREVIARSSVMSRILFVSPKDVDDLMVTLPGIKRNIVKDYFRRLQDMSDVVIPDEVSDVEDEDYEIEIDDTDSMDDDDAMVDDKKKKKKSVDDDVIYNGESKQHFKIEVVDEGAYSDVEIQTIELAPKRRHHRPVRVKEESNQSLVSTDLFRLDNLSILSEQQFSERTASSSGDSSSESEDEDAASRKPPKKPRSKTKEATPKNNSEQIDDVIALDSDDGESETDDERYYSSGSETDDRDWEREFALLSSCYDDDRKEKSRSEDRSDDVVVVTESSASAYKNVEDVPLLYLSDVPKPFGTNKRVDTVDEVIQTEETTASDAQTSSNQSPSVPEAGASKDLEEKPTETNPRPQSSKQEQIMELLQSLDQLLQDGDPNIKLELLKKFESLKASKPVNGEKSTEEPCEEELLKTAESIEHRESEADTVDLNAVDESCEHRISEEQKEVSDLVDQDRSDNVIAREQETATDADSKIIQDEEMSEHEVVGHVEATDADSKIVQDEEISEHEVVGHVEATDADSKIIQDEEISEHEVVGHVEATDADSKIIHDEEMSEHDVVGHVEVSNFSNDIEESKQESSNAGDEDASNLISQLVEVVEGQEKVDDVTQDDTELSRDMEAVEDKEGDVPEENCLNFTTNITEWSQGIGELLPTHEELSEEVEIRDNISIAEENIDILLQSDPEVLDGDFNLLQNEVIIGDVEIVDVAKYEVVDTEGNEIKDLEQSNNNLPLPKEDLVAEVIGNSGIAISIAPSGIGLDHGLLTPEHSDDKEGSIGDENIVNESCHLKFNDFSEDENELSLENLHGQVYLEPGTGSFININLDNRSSNDPLPIKILNIMSNYKPEDGILSRSRKLEAKAEECPMTADGKKIGSVRPMTVRNPKSIIEKALQDANVDFLSEKSNFYRGKMDGDGADAPPVYPSELPTYPACHLKIDALNDYLLESDGPDQQLKPAHEPTAADDEKQLESDYEDCMFDAEENKIQGIDGFSVVDGKSPKDAVPKGKVIFTSSTYIDSAKRNTASLEDFQRFEQNIYDQRIKKMKVNGADDEEYDDFLFRDEISTKATKKRRPNDVKQNNKKNQRHSVGWGPVITKTFDAFNEGTYQLLNGDATVHDLGSGAFTGHELDRRSGGFEPLKSEFMPNGVRSSVEVSKLGNPPGHSKLQQKKKTGPAPPKGILKKKEVVPTLFNLDVHSEYERLKRKNKVEAPTCTVPPKIRKVGNTNSGLVYCGVEPNDEKIYSLVPRICLPKCSESELRRQYYATFTDKLLSNHHTKQRCILYRMDIEKDKEARKKEEERRKAEEEESLRLPSEVPDPDYLKKHPVSGFDGYAKPEPYGSTRRRAGSYLSGDTRTDSTARISGGVTERRSRVRPPRTKIRTRPKRTSFSPKDRKDKSLERAADGSVEVGQFQRERRRTSFES